MTRGEWYSRAKWKLFILIVAETLGCVQVWDYVRLCMSMLRFVLSVKCIFIHYSKLRSDFRRRFAIACLRFRHEIYEYGIAFATKENTIFFGCLKVRPHHRAQRRHRSLIPLFLFSSFLLFLQSVASRRCFLSDFCTVSRRTRTTNAHRMTMSTRRTKKPTRNVVPCELWAIKSQFMMHFHDGDAVRCASDRLNAADVRAWQWGRSTLTVEATGRQWPLPSTDKCGCCTQQARSMQIANIVYQIDYDLIPPSNA